MYNCGDYERSKFGKLKGQTKRFGASIESWLFDLVKGLFRLFHVM